MKLSTKVRYGTRAMLDLSLYYGNGLVLLKDIAKRQEVSPKYLDRILSSLKAAGLVKTLRGAKGGYVLSRPPSQIRLNHIFEALDGAVELVECANNKDFCHRVNFCIMHDVWAELGNSIESMLTSMTLADLVMMDKRKKRSAEKMYYI